ncbi:MAG TPA: hypothetical protein VFM54_14400 [Micromonosporaceae bacterium]|nr:hypothetical protein [Micromonosporaceae bacterium]
MSRRIFHLLALCGVVTLAVLAPATAASAAGPTSVTIDGPGLKQPLTVTAAAQPDAFRRLLTEVSWLATPAGNAPAPDPATLGPKFIAVILVNQKPDQAYELYPQAAGGPRVFRPANQPHRRKTAAAWFYGRLSLEDSLRDAGVPLSSNGVRVITGGRGGGSGEAIVPGVATSSSPKAASLGQMIDQWRLSVLLSGGVALVLMLGLAGMARMARR